MSRRERTASALARQQDCDVLPRASARDAAGMLNGIFGEGVCPSVFATWEIATLI